MPLSEQKLRAYRAHLASRGLAETTQEQYCRQVRLAHESPDLLTRLRGRLSPKAKRLCKASLLSWARYRGDMKLQERLRDFRLPPPSRIKPKRIFSREQWQGFREVIDNVENEPMQAVIGLMTYRGLRVGDALWVHRADIEAALTAHSLVFEGKGGKFYDFGGIKSFRHSLNLLLDQPWHSADRVFELISPTEKTAANRVGTLVGELGEQIGFTGAHPHLLRSTYATYFYQACGNDLVALQEHMQWSNLETARQYVVQHNREELDKIAEGMFDGES